MFNKTATRLTENLIKNQIISESDSEIYRFGFETGFVLLVNVAVTLSFGFILGMPIESIIVLLVLIPLRSCAGGIHASNNIKCIILSTFLFSIVLIASRFSQSITSIAMILVLGIACSIIILALAPVQDANKPIKKDEARTLKQRTLKVLLIEIAILSLLLFLGFNLAATVLAFTLFLVCISVSVGALRNYITRTGNETTIN